MEDALEELLARDTQYRKELNSHLEKRLHIAEERRRSRVEEFKEVIYARSLHMSLDFPELKIENSKQLRRELAGLC